MSLIKDIVMVFILTLAISMSPNDTFGNFLLALAFYVLLIKPVNFAFSS